MEDRENQKRPLLQKIKAGEWNKELFEEVKQYVLHSRKGEPCIFNDLRKVLSAKQYEEFDYQYCLAGRPQDKAVILSIRAEKRKEECQKLLEKKKELLNELMNRY